MRRFRQFSFVCFMTACALVICCPGIALPQGNATAPTVADVRQSIVTVRTSRANDEVLNQARSMGQSLLRVGRFAEAADLFAALAEKKPGDFVVLYGQALATFNAGHPAQAEPLARRAMEIALPAARADRQPERIDQAADSLVLLSVILAVQKNDQAALKLLQQAVEIAPDHFDAELSMGRLLFGMGDDNGAIKFFRTATSLQPTNTEARFFLATALERAGDIQGALSSYRKLIEMKSDGYEGHLGLGALLLKQGGKAVDEGQKELARALEINPNLYEARVALGRSLIARGQPLEAITHLQRAAELAPQNPEPHYQLSLAYRRLGQGDAAAQEAAIVKRINESRRVK